MTAGTDLSHPSKPPGHGRPRPSHHLAPLFKRGYLPHVLENVLSRLSNSDLATCMCLASHIRSVASPLLYDHLCLSVDSNPFVGLERYELDGQPIGPISETKRSCLLKVRKLDIRGHYEATCCRYSPLGWVTPSLKVLRLFDGTVGSPSLAPPYGSHGQPRVPAWITKYGHPARPCKFLQDLAAPTLVIFDLYEPVSIARQPISVATLPPTFDRAVFVLNGQERNGGAGEMAFSILPLSVKHLVFVLRTRPRRQGLGPYNPHLPLRLESFAAQIGDIVGFDTRKQYTIVNCGRAGLSGTEKLDEEGAGETVKDEVMKKVGGMLRQKTRLTLEETDEVLARIEFVTLMEYMCGKGKEEFEPEEVSGLLGGY